MFTPINLRKLVALDMVLHGTKLIVAEFVLTVALGLVFGLLSLARGHALWQIVLGAGLLVLAINYVPLLVFAVLIARKRSAAEEARPELSKGRSEIMRYTRQSFLLVIPFVVPLLAIRQAWQREKMK